MNFRPSILTPALVWALLAAPLGAQDLVRHVETTGHAEVSQAPDQAVVTLGVESWETDLAQARADNDGRMARLMAVPARFSLDPKDVRTDFASIEPQYDMGDRGQTRSIAGYRVTKLVTVIVKDLSRVEAFVTAALGAGANRLDRVSFVLADPSKAAAEARLMAVRAARTKAEALARELGVSIGGPLVIADLSGEGAGPQPRFKAMSAAAYDMGGGEGDIFAPGQVVVTAQVNVWFELKD